ncbi:MAG: hypothetical protein WA954_12200 [Parerythrobacter sp.]
MSGLLSLGPGLLVLALLVLMVWVVVLVMLAGWIMLFLRSRHGWALFDWRTIAIPFVGLIAAIQLGNYLLDLLGSAIDGGGAAELAFPSAFLIGSVAIGVGIAAVRARGG